VAKITDLIEPSNTWDVVDSSKLSTFMECPRKYFYRYVLGWSASAPNVHLIFGTAWHAAVERLLLEGYDKVHVEEAKFIFLQYYRQYIPEEADELYVPKNPAGAFNALDLYANRFKNDLVLNEFPHTEVGGTVLIDTDAPMHFKIDAIGKEKSTGKYWILDHKTSQSKTRRWSSSWQLRTQILLYMHVLYCLYSPDNVKGARVRGSFFYKKLDRDAEFDEAVIEKTPDQMQAWLSSCNSWYKDLKYNMSLLLEEDNDENSVMHAFPQNDTACDKYWGCPYLDFCNAWANPLKRCNIPSIGYEVTHWDPRDIPTIRKDVDLTI